MMMMMKMDNMIILLRYPLELHMVHRNIHDETVSEAVKHENGLTVLGFKFQLVKESETASEGVDTLAKIAEKFLVDTGSKFSKGDIETEVVMQTPGNRKTNMNDSVQG